MTNIIDILKACNVTIPEDQLAGFNKAFNENYKTIVEHQKALDKIASEKKRADTAEETLKGFDGIDPANIQKQLREANDAVAAAKAEAQKQIEERDFNDALSKELDKLKFTSAAARKAVEAEIRGTEGLKLRNGEILGLNDLIKQIKASDADAFQPEGAPPPKFTSPNTSGGNNGGSLTTQDIMKERDPAKRQKLIGENLHLFKRGE